MIAADFNGDGILDLAWGAEAYFPGVGVSLGSGDGSFSGPTILSTTQAGLLAAGDINGDGRMDLYDGASFVQTAPIEVSISPSTLNFGSPVVGTHIAAQTVQVQNTGLALLTFISIQTSPNFAESDSCQQNLLAFNGQCTISVTFDPTTAGPLTGTLTLTDNSSSSPQTVQLSGTEVLLAPNVFPLGLVFNNQLVGTTSASQSVTITNPSTLAMSITNLSISNNWTQTNNCLPFIAASGSCTINVSFAPTASGPLTGMLTLSDYASNSPQTVSLSGTGLVPVVSLSSTSLTFAGQSVSTTSASQSVTLTNSGTGALTSLTITASGDFAQTNNCAGSVAPTTSCTINVTFNPAAIGSRTGVLTLTDNVANSPQTVNLSGTGLGATVSLSASSMTFSNQSVGTTSASQQVTLQNTGNTGLSVTSIALGGVNPGDFSLSQTCGNSVAAGADCALNVTFTPTTYGARTATISLVDSAANSPQTISLSGTGNAPTASLSPSSLTFPGQFVGTTGLPQNITLTNNGNVALTISSAQPSSAQFGLTNGCTSSLAAGVSCTISVFFDPSASGTQTGTLTLTDNAPGSPQTVALTGTGQDFSFAPPSGASTSASAVPGQPANYTLSVGGQGGLAGTITFTCTGAPSEATCTVPSSVTAGSSPTNVSVTVTTTAPSVSAPRSRPSPPIPPLPPGLRSLLMLALVLAAIAWAVRRRKQPGATRWQLTIAPLALGLLLTLALAGCGGGGGGGGGGISNPGTPAGTYTLTVTGTTGSGSSALSHSVILTLTVT
jgi:hypothetical protein